jgi:hypothetical protein
MKKIIFKIYDRYEGIKEPWRFILFFAFVMLNVMGTHSENAIIVLVSLVAFLIAFATRFWYILGDAKYKRIK